MAKRRKLSNIEYFSNFSKDDKAYNINATNNLFLNIILKIKNKNKIPTKYDKIAESINK